MAEYYGPKLEVLPNQVRGRINRLQDIPALEVTLSVLSPSNYPNANSEEVYEKKNGKVTGAYFLDSRRGEESCYHIELRGDKGALKTAFHLLQVPTLTKIAGDFWVPITPKNKKKGNGRKEKRNGKSRRHTNYRGRR